MQTPGMMPNEAEHWRGSQHVCIFYLMSLQALYVRASVVHCPFIAFASFVWFWGTVLAILDLVSSSHSP